MTVLALSPHLDDAAFSAGGTLARLARAGHAVTVATVFTESVSRPAGFALRCQTDKGLAPDADYMAIRRAEDLAACARLGAEALHLDLPEAPHRGYDSPEALFAGVHSADRHTWRDVLTALRALVSARAARARPDVPGTRWSRRPPPRRAGRRGTRHRRYGRVVARRALRDPRARRRACRPRPPPPSPRRASRSAPPTSPRASTRAPPTRRSFPTSSGAMRDADPETALRDTLTGIRPGRGAAPRRRRVRRGVPHGCARGADTTPPRHLSRYRGGVAEREGFEPSVPV